MPDLEGRVSVLETRVDVRAVDSQHAVDTATAAARNAVTAKDAHRKNIQLLSALRQTQIEHGQLLDEHSRKLDEHSRKLDEHGAILRRHEERLDSIDGRLGDIDGRLGQITVGVHAIELMMRRLVDDDTSPPTQQLP